MTIFKSYLDVIIIKHRWSFYRFDYPSDVWSLLVFWFMLLLYVFKKMNEFAWWHLTRSELCVWRASIETFVWWPIIGSLQFCNWIKINSTRTHTCKQVKIKALQTEANIFADILHIKSRTQGRNNNNKKLHRREKDIAKTHTHTHAECNQSQLTMM